jgi:hypothetical protein
MPSSAALGSITDCRFVSKDRMWGSGESVVTNINRQQMEARMKEVQGIHPAWIALIRHCREIGFGELKRLKIQDGVPVMVERSIQRIKLT